MKWTIPIAVLIFVFAFPSFGQDGVPITKVSRIEIDGKKVKKPYKVSFLRNGEWIEAKRTEAGFFVPDEMKSDEWLSVLIAFGKYRLEFSKIHISKFGQSWTIGIDKPYSEEYAPPGEMGITTRTYYIEFEGGEPETRLVVTVSKASN